MSEATMERIVDLDAPADAVWTALTDDDALSSWFGGSVHLDAVPGGTGRFEDGDGAVRCARVDDVVPGTSLSFRWWREGDDDGPITVVRFELTPRGDATRVVVTERPLLVGRTRARASAMGTFTARLGAWTATLQRV